MTKKILLLLSLFCCLSQPMEKDQEEGIDLLSSLPNEIKRPIVSDLVTSFHVEDAGKHLRALQCVNRQWKEYIDDETEYLITKASEIYQMPRLVTALYFGTKKARDYEKESREKIPYLESFLESKNALLHALLLLDLNSNLSKKIVEHFSYEKFHESKGWLNNSCFLENENIVAERMINYKSKPPREVYFDIYIKDNKSGNINKKLFKMPGSEIKIFKYNDEIIFHTIFFEKSKKIYRIWRTKQVQPSDLHKYEFSGEFKGSEKFYNHHSSWNYGYENENSIIYIR